MCPKSRIMSEVEANKVANVDYKLIAERTLEIEIEALQDGLNSLDDGFFGAIDLIMNLGARGRVVVMGVGKSGHVGGKISATLASTGTPALFVHPGEAGHGDLGMITRDDVVLAISQSGTSDEILRLIPYIKRTGISLIVMTGQPESPLASYADFLINTRVQREACPLGLAPTASTTLTLALGDATAMCLLNGRGFTEDNFAETHPHGALGRRLLLKVEDIMSLVGNAPIVDQDVSVRMALSPMSLGGLGFVIIVDTELRPVGVFTDGDLRRCLDQNLDVSAVQISDVMTKKFEYIKNEQLAVSALEVMERGKVSALPVVDERGGVVGAINMRQLLQAGVL